MKTTIKLSFDQLLALNEFLKAIISNEKEISKGSLYIKIQIELLGGILLKKVYPKTLVDTGKEVKIKLNRAEALSYQLAFYNGWASYCEDLYTQNVIRKLSIEQMPKIAITSQQQLEAPDVWD